MTFIKSILFIESPHFWKKSSLVVKSQDFMYKVKPFCKKSILVEKEVFCSFSCTNIQIITTKYGEFLNVFIGKIASFKTIKTVL